MPGNWLALRRYALGGRPAPPSCHCSSVRSTFSRAGLAGQLIRVYSSGASAEVNAPLRAGRTAGGNFAVNPLDRADRRRR